MKRILIVLMVLGLAASLGAQSLADLAKREKARRESLGRHAVVIRNGDLLLVKKTPAVEVTRPEGWTGEGDQAAEGGANPYEAAGLPEAGPEATAEPGQARAGAEAIPEGGGTLEEQLKVLDARVEELTDEMNSLRQQYEAQNSMVPGYVIQQRMDETNARLTQALARQAEVRAKLGNRAPAPKKDPANPDR
ncbi:MAG TPA: hypothetical protein VLN41_01900 [Candidatus Bathyarchaeia archaeon]|nr:hypothetical protein [Candidatus Bathyarchaeia archaeon]